jgi:hypothetical protein
LQACTAEICRLLPDLGVPVHAACVAFAAVTLIAYGGIAYGGVMMQIMKICAHPSLPDEVSLLLERFSRNSTPHDPD